MFNFVIDDKISLIDVFYFPVEDKSTTLKALYLVLLILQITINKNRLISAYRLVVNKCWSSK